MRNTNIPREENLNNLLSKLLEDNNFKFLVLAIRQREYLLSHAKSKALFSETVKSTLADVNFIYNESKYYYLGDDDWNILFNNILTANSKTSNVISNPRLLKVIESIKESSISSKYQTIFNLMVLNNDDIYKTIIYCLQKKLVKMHDKDKDNSGVSYTSLSYEFGSMFMNLFMTRIPMFKALLVYNKDKNISFNYVEMFSSLLHIIYQNNIKEIKNFYAKYKIDNSLLIDIINAHIQNFALDLYLENDITFSKSNKLVKEYLKEISDTIYKEKYSKSIKQFNINLGSLVVDALANYDFVNKKYDYNYKRTPLRVIIKYRDDIELLLTESLYKPYLKENNISGNLNDDIYFTLYKERLHNKIHFNNTMASTLNKGTYLSEKEEPLRLTIDSDYLYYFLSSLINIYKYRNKKDLDILYGIYKLNYDTILNNLNEVSDKLFVDNFLKFCLDFNNILHMDLKEKIKHMAANKKQYFSNLYSKILNYKIYLVNLLREAVIYEVFGYFNLNTYLDVRGRSYLHGYFLNIQSFPISKAFIKIYTLPSKKLYENIELINRSFKTILKYDSSKQSIDTYCVKKLKKESAYCSLNFIYNFFDNKKITYEVFCNKISDISNLETFILTNIKSIYEYHIVHSYILTHIKRNTTSFKSNVICFDATTSGYQMTSILLRDKKLATLANLVDSNVKHDIYILTIKNMQLIFNNINIIVEDFEKAYLYEYTPSKVLPLDRDIYADLQNKDLNNLFDYFYNVDLTKSYRLPEFFSLLENKSNKNDDISHYSFLFNKFDEEILEKRTYLCKNRNIIKYYLLIKHWYNFKYSLNQNSWIYNFLFDRNTFKKNIMTFSYNSTAYGRKEELETYFTNLANDLGLKLDKQALTISCQYLEKLFNICAIKYLGIDCMFPLTEKIARLDKEIIIKNKYLKIMLMPAVTEKVRINVQGLSDNKRQHQLTLQQKRIIKDHIKIDSERMRQTFSPNFIHSMDAFIVHTFKDRLRDFNIALKTNGLFISHYTNHDSFYTSILPYTKILILDIYKSLYELDYISTIKDSMTLEQYNSIRECIRNIDDPNYLTLDDIKSPYFLK